MDASWYGWSNDPNENRELVALYCELHRLRGDYEQLTPENHKVILNNLCTNIRLYVYSLGDDT